MQSDMHWEQYGKFMKRGKKRDNPENNNSDRDLRFFKKEDDEK